MAEGLVGGEGFAVDASIIRADANRSRGLPSDQPIDWQHETGMTRAVQEYLAGLEEINSTETSRRNISLTDPQSRWTSATGEPAFYACSTNYLVDLEAGIIVDVEATQAVRTEEVESTRVMIDRVEDRFGIKPDRLVADTAYGNATMLNWMVNDNHIEPHVPVWDKTGRTDGTLSRSNFQWNEEANEYRCPEGHALRNDWRPFKNPRSRITKADTLIYKSIQSECKNCPMKAQCCPNTLFRKITRSLYEPARDVARAIAKTDAYKQSCNDRKKVEMLFAHMKCILKLDRLRLRGRNGAQDEFLLVATAQNLRRMAKWLTPIAPEGAPIPA